MVESNKILTVSYGTFSCTLEGFDDAFETMKAIAEYFRDLAAEDRFFGAEPPTPDAEMLARIAERSSTRRIEARSEENGIVLRQGAADTASAAPAAAVAAAAPVAEAAAPSAEIAEAPAEEIAPETGAGVEEPVEAPRIDEVVDADEADDVAEVAAEDMDVMSAVAAASQESETAADADFEVDADAIHEEAADEGGLAEALAEEAEALDAVEDMLDDDAPETAFDADDAEDDILADDRLDVAAADETETFEAEYEDTAVEAEVVAPAAADDDDNGIVAKLRRIRAVVSRSRAGAAPVAFSEDQHADEMVEETGVDLGPLHAATTTPVEDESIGQADGYEDEGFEDEDFGEDALAHAGMAIADDEALADDDDAEDAAAFEDDEAGEESWSEEEWAFEEDAEEDAFAEAATDVLPEQAEAYDEPAPVSSARVVKVKRSDFEAAVARGDIEEEADDRAQGSSLSPEDEAELQSELAALEAEINNDLGDDADAHAHEALGEEAYEDDEADWEDTISTLVTEFEDDELDEFGPEAAAGEAADALGYEDEAYDEDDYDEEVEPLVSEAAFDDEDAYEDESELAGAEAALDEEAYEDDHAEDTAEFAGSGEEEDTLYEDESDDSLFDDEADDSLMDDADVTAEEDDDSLFGDPNAETPAALAGRDKLAASASTDDMDRILAETNSQLGESEGTRRRSAIAHLRAAVAATKAEKQAGSDLRQSEGDSADAYRKDLAQVVRPRRPRPSGTPLRRTEDKPAPLRLVAEQRVDIENEHREPVRPRRVSIADLIRQEAESEAPEAAGEGYEGLPKGEASGFVDFLEQSDATELNEVLECAAAYLAFVEGREQFSRPQLMSRVREADPEGYTREDALRAFGTLLREGKIRKVKGGRFTASDRIGFRPDRREAV